MASITDLRAWASLAQAVDTGVTGGVSKWLARDCRGGVLLKTAPTLLHKHRSLKLEASLTWDLCCCCEAARRLGGSRELCWL